MNLIRLSERQSKLRSLINILFPRSRGEELELLVKYYFPNYKDIIIDNGILVKYNYYFDVCRSDEHGIGDPIARFEFNDTIFCERMVFYFSLFYCYNILKNDKFCKVRKFIPFLYKTDYYIDRIIPLYSRILIDYFGFENNARKIKLEGKWIGRKSDGYYFIFLVTYNSYFDKIMLFRTRYMFLSEMIIKRIVSKFQNKFDLSVDWM